MATRRERVVIELEDGLTAGVLREAAAVAVLNRELDKLGGVSSKAKRNMDPLARETIPQTTRNSDSASKSIDKLSGRLSLLVQGLGAVGPAAIPIGAVAIPAVTTLASGLGFLAVGAGTTVLAFHGLGDALTKFNKASAEPTATNIAAAQAAMDKIAPSAQQFVLELHKLGPELERLQQAAGSGLFPGLTEGIKEAQAALPAVERIFSRVGTEMGTLSSEAGRSLGSREWAPFLKFIGDEAPHALGQMGHALGSVTHGLAQLWMATEPLNSGGLDWIEKAAQGFDHWATGLDHTQGFQDFIAYVQTNGPAVEELLKTTGDLFVNLIKDAAPLGGPTLQALDGLLKVLDLIAASPIGPPLLVLVQALSVARLAMTGLGKVSGATFGPAGQLSLKKYGSGLQKNIALWRELNATERSAYLTSEEGARRATARSQVLGSFGKGALALGAIGLVSSGVTDKLGATSTAMDAMAGAMVGGVPGAVAGGLIGAVMDYRSAASQATATQRHLNDVFSSSTSSINDYAAALSSAAADARSAYAEFGNDGGRPLASIGDTLKDPYGAAANALQVLKGSDLARQKAAAFAAAQEQQVNAAAVLAQIGSTLGDPSLQPQSQIAGIKLAAPTFLVPDGSTQQGLAKLTQLASRAQPAMDALGISLHQLSTEPPAFQARDVTAITKWIHAADSAKGRTDAVAHAFAQMGDDSLSASDRVQALSDALDALTGPSLSLSAAADALHSGLNKLKSSLSASGHELTGFSNAAIQNRGVIRDQVTDITDWVKAQAAAGVAPKKMTDGLLQQRQALIDAGTAAGLSKSDLKDYLDTLGLTPRLVRTAIQLVGTDQAEKNLQHLTRDRVIHITARIDHLGVQDTTGAGGHVLTGPGFADGGTVPGPRHPYRDSVLAILAGTEEVITNRNGQADQFRADRASGRIPAYADGGAVARSIPRADPPAPFMAQRWTGQAPAIDYDRLTRALLNARPLYGPVSVNGDPTSFRRTMQQDHAKAAMSGVRRG